MCLERRGEATSACLTPRQAQTLTCLLRWICNRGTTKQVFGTDDVSFTACSTTVGPGGTCTDATPVIRSYSTFSQAADENAVSRIYIGIHFRKAVETGVHHGRRIAAYAVHQFMKRVQ